jgi:hypothetical protein
MTAPDPKSISRIFEQSREASNRFILSDAMLAQSSVGAIDKIA